MSVLPSAPKLLCRFLSLFLVPCLVLSTAVESKIIQDQAPATSNFFQPTLATEALAAVSLTGPWMRILRRVPNPVRLLKSSGHRNQAGVSDRSVQRVEISNLEKTAKPMSLLPQYVGSGATSIHRAIVDANSFLKDGPATEGIALLTELIEDLETAWKDRNIEPLMEKWNERYPSELEVDLLIRYIPIFSAYARELLEDLQRHPGENRSIVEIANDPDSPIFKEIERAHLLPNMPPAPMEWLMEQLQTQEQVTKEMSHEFTIQVADLPILRQATGGEDVITVRLRGEYPDVDHILEQIVRQFPLLEDLSFMWSLRIDGNLPAKGIETVLPGQAIEIVLSKRRPIWRILQTAFSSVAATVLINSLLVPVVTVFAAGPASTPPVTSAVVFAVDTPGPIRFDALWSDFGDWITQMWMIPAAGLGIGVWLSILGTYFASTKGVGYDHAPSWSTRRVFGQVILSLIFGGILTALGFTASANLAAWISFWVNFAVGGTVGNAIELLQYGAVRDFIPMPRSRLASVGDYVGRIGLGLTILGAGYYSGSLLWGASGLTDWLLISAAAIFTIGVSYFAIFLAKAKPAVASRPAVVTSVLQLGEYLKRHRQRGYTAPVLAELLGLEYLGYEAVLAHLKNLAAAGTLHMIPGNHSGKAVLFSVAAKPINLDNFRRSKGKPATEDAIVKVLRRYGKPMSIRLVRFMLDDWRTTYGDVGAHLKALIRKGEVVAEVSSGRHYYRLASAPSSVENVPSESSSESSALKSRWRASAAILKAA